MLNRKRASARAMQAIKKGSRELTRRRLGKRVRSTTVNTVFNRLRAHSTRLAAPCRIVKTPDRDGFDPGPAVTEVSRCREPIYAARSRNGPNGVFLQ